ncbi:hypothetical protein [Pseudomonas quasicaspiana]|uniref:hypothetical protein n=1 Tax=Pseudomonas quasicaspiana TaxID=2829821 RepID=UPI001E395DB0|nr:hypothetical protein [Pseudomonas quasicaspiana]MCD5969814.1 hypothetical protein [Pseudomonas quasicaspiana]
MVAVPGAMLRAYHRSEAPQQRCQRVILANEFPAKVATELATQTTVATTIMFSGVRSREPLDVQIMVWFRICLAEAFQQSLNKTLWTIKQLSDNARLILT